MLARALAGDNAGRWPFGRARVHLLYRTVGSHLYRIFPKLGITSRLRSAEPCRRRSTNRRVACTGGFPGQRRDDVLVGSRPSREAGLLEAEPGVPGIASQGETLAPCLDNPGGPGHWKGSELGGRTGRRQEMIRNVLLFMIPLAVAGLIASQRQEITRYLKLKQMSSGTGHPENVPAGGSHAYPDPGGGAADGTGDFDSASRGGPARAR